MIRHTNGMIVTFIDYDKREGMYYYDSYSGDQKNTGWIIEDTIDAMIKSNEWEYYPPIIVIEPVKLDEELFIL